MCSRTGVSNRPGDSYPAAERLANVLCEAVHYRSSAAANVSDKQRYVFHSCCWNPCEDLNKYGREHQLVSPIQPTFVSVYHDSRAAIVFVSEGSEVVKTTTLSFKLNQLEVLLSQHADTMIPMYEIMQTPLICYGNLLYVKERLAIYYSLLKRSLRFSCGQHDIEWDSLTALHVTRMNVMRKADNEHSLAMIEVMNRIKYAFGHGLLARKIQENISPITVERVRQTTDISRQERKRHVVRMDHSVYVFNDGGVMVFGGYNECHFCREYNISLLPVIPIYGSHFAGSKVTPPEEGPSQRHHNLSRRRKLREALRRSWGSVEKYFELSTTTTAGLLPVPTRMSATTRTITRGKGQKLQAPPSQCAKFCVTRPMRAATWQWP